MHLALPWWGLNPQHDLFLTSELLDVCFSFVPGREAVRRTSLTGDLCTPRLICCLTLTGLGGPVAQWDWWRDIHHVPFVDHFLSMQWGADNFVSKPPELKFVTEFAPVCTYGCVKIQDEWQQSDIKSRQSFRHIQYLNPCVLLKERHRQLLQTPIRFVLLAELWQIEFLQTLRSYYQTHNLTRCPSSALKSQAVKLCNLMVVQLQLDWQQFFSWCYSRQSALHMSIFFCSSYSISSEMGDNLPKSSFN